MTTAYMLKKQFKNVNFEPNIQSCIFSQIILLFHSNFIHKRQ